MSDSLNLPSPVIDPSQFCFDAAEPRLTAIVGRTVFAANDVVSAWAMLYAAISGHSLPFVGALFDRWARETVQREGIARLARDFLQKLPHELEQVEALLVTAEDLARARDLLVGQPWSLCDLDERAAAPRADVVLEREAQFEWLLSSLQDLQKQILRVAAEFRISRDVEKVRLLNGSAVLAAELRFRRKTAKP